MTSELAFLLTVVVFWAVIYVVSYIFHLEKHGLEIRPAYLTYKSKRLKGLLVRISKRRHVFWRTLCNLGLALAVGQMIFSIYFLISNLLRFAYPLGQTIPVFLVLPGVTIRLYWLPYFFTSTAIIIMTHELAHGIAALIERIPIKSAGLLLLLVFFGGFVEPDEKRFERASTLSKLRMLSAGSSTNFITGLLALMLLMGLFAPASGILIQETSKDGPAGRAGLQRLDVIYAINATDVFTVQDFQNYMTNAAPGETLILNTTRGNIYITTERDSKNQTTIGLVSISNYHPCRLVLERLIGIHLYLTLDWTFLIAWSIAVFNMLPTYPWDGEKFLYYTLENVVKKRRREVRIIFNTVFWSLIAANMILSFLKYGLLSV